MTMRRTASLLAALALATALSACGDEEPEPATDPASLPSAADLTAACEALIPTDAGEALGWTGAGKPMWETSSCVAAFDQGRIEIERRSFGAEAVDDLQAGADDTFSEGCEAIQNVEGIDEKYQPQLDFMSPEYTACGTGFSTPGGFSSTVVRLDSAAVVLIMVRPQEDTDMSKIESASKLLAGAARDHFTDPEAFVP